MQIKNQKSKIENVLAMIIRDLYRCPTEDLHKAIIRSRQPVLHRGVVGPASVVELADVDYLVSYPDFDPSLSSVAYEGGDPVAFLVSRIEAGEAVWSLFGGAGRALEMLLDEAMAHWRQEGATRARQGLTGLLGSLPRMAEDADLVNLLKDRGFEVQGLSVEMVAELKKLAVPKEAAEREAEMRRSGYVPRPARPEEVALIARQYHPRHTGQLSQEFWNVLVRHLLPEGLVVLDFRRHLAGYAAYLGWTLGGECPQIGPVFVESVHRRPGLDEMLLLRALDVAKRAGKPRVKVHCKAEKARFYERAGFAAAARFCHEAVAELGLDRG